MRFAMERCPACGKAPDYVVESMYVHFGLERDREGELEYTGHSDEFVETSEPVEDIDGRVTLGCEDGHEWLTPSRPQEDTPCAASADASPRR